MIDKQVTAGNVEAVIMNIKLGPDTLDVVVHVYHRNEGSRVGFTWALLKYRPLMLSEATLIENTIHREFGQYKESHTLFNGVVDSKGEPIKNLQSLTMGVNLRYLHGYIIPSSDSTIMTDFRVYGRLAYIAREAEATENLPLVPILSIQHIESISQAVINALYTAPKVMVLHKDKYFLITESNRDGRIKVKQWKGSSMPEVIHTIEVANVSRVDTMIAIGRSRPVEGLSNVLNRDGVPLHISRLHGQDTNVQLPPSLMYKVTGEDKHTYIYTSGVQLDAYVRSLLNGDSILL